MIKAVASASQIEVDRNYEKFLELLPKIIGDHEGKFALMSKGEIVEYYDSFGDACNTGDKFLKRGNYSVQEVTYNAIDLGAFSRVGN